MKFTYAAVLSASTALAQVVVENIDIGVGPRPSGNDSIDFDDGNSVADQTMQFSLYYPPPDNGPGAPMWSWRVQLNEAQPDDSDVPNARILNTVYDFSFDADNLPQAVANNVRAL